MRKHAGLFLIASLAFLASSPAHAAGSYSIVVDGNTLRSGSAAVSVDTTYGTATSNAAWSYRATGDARPGGVRTTTQAGLDVYIAYSFAGGNTASSSASTSDFVITGPPGATSVTGTCYFSLHGNVELEGGYPANNGQQGGIEFLVSAGGIGWLGQWISGNGSSYGLYSLAGYPGPGVGTVIGLTGSFPVGSGFGVSVNANTWSYPYGNNTYSPMLIRTAASGSPLGATTVAIGNLTGLVMDLPAGYTVASAEWNVVNSKFLAPVLDAPHATAPSQTGLALLSPNPNAGASRLRFTLTASGPARVAVFDMAGRTVRMLVDGWVAAGEHQAEWDGTLADGRAAPPGVYFASLQAGARTTGLRIVRLR